MPRRGSPGSTAGLINSARSNLAEAAPRAREADDVGALAGGSSSWTALFGREDEPVDGADPVLARAVLTVVRFEPEVRAWRPSSRSEH